MAEVRNCGVDGLASDRPCPFLVDQHSPGPVAGCWQITASFADGYSERSRFEFEMYELIRRLDLLKMLQRTRELKRINIQCECGWNVTFHCFTNCTLET